MGPNSYNLALVHHDNPISIDHSRQAMSNHQYRPVGAERVQRQLHCSFALCIQCTGRFIQEQH